MSSRVEDPSPSSQLLRNSKKLYWSKTGETNYIHWLEDLSQAARSAFGIYSECIVSGRVPREWVNDYPRPLNYAALDAYDRDLVKMAVENHNRVREGYRQKRPQMASFILSNMMESSIKRLKDLGREDFDNAVRDNDITDLLDRIRRANIFRGRAASSSEVQIALAEATGFHWKSPETLAEFKHRWDNLFEKKFVNLAIPNDMFPRELRVVTFAKALCRYGHSAAVRNACIEYVARVDHDQYRPYMKTSPCANPARSSSPMMVRRS